MLLCVERRCVHGIQRLDGVQAEPFPLHIADLFFLRPYDQPLQPDVQDIHLPRTAAVADNPLGFDVHLGKDAVLSDQGAGVDGRGVFVEILQRRFRVNLARHHIHAFIHFVQAADFILFLV